MIAVVSRYALWHLSIKVFGSIKESNFTKKNQTLSMKSKIMYHLRLKCSIKIFDNACKGIYRIYSFERRSAL